MINQSGESFRFGSICSGIGAAELAFSKLGWKCVFSSEIEAFPRTVLENRFKGVKLYGDFREINDERVDLLVGGTPCQSFSLAGKRKGLTDSRGNLTLEYARLVRRLRPKWFILENVPGLFISEEGRDFAKVLEAFSGRRGIHIDKPWSNAGICEPGDGDESYGLAWRIYDSQGFGVCQGRRRCFMVGYHGDWRPPAALHFVGPSVFGDIGKHRIPGNKIGTLTAMGAGNVLWTQAKQKQLMALEDKVNGKLAVRRITELECERAMGFPDGWTDLGLSEINGKERSDRALSRMRYKALGNSMVVPVMYYLGLRINAVNESLESEVPAS